jgi:hypothetical protein
MFFKNQLQKLFLFELNASLIYVFKYHSITFMLFYIFLTVFYRTLFSFSAFPSSHTSFQYFPYQRFTWKSLPWLQHVLWGLNLNSRFFPRRFSCVDSVSARLLFENILGGSSTCHNLLLQRLFGHFNLMLLKFQFFKNADYGFDSRNFEFRPFSNHIWLV